MHPRSMCISLTQGEEKQMFLAVPLYLVVVDRGLLSRSKAIFTDLFRTEIICLNQLYGCRPACRSQSMRNCNSKSVAGGFDDEEQMGALYPTLDMGSLEAKHDETDTTLILPCLKAIKTSQIFVYSHETKLLFLVIAGFYLISYQRVWVMLGTAKQGKYINVNDTTKYLQRTEYTLSLHIQVSTTIQVMLVWVLTAFRLEKKACWGSCSYLLHYPGSRICFLQDVWFKTCSHHHINETQSTMFV